MIPVAVMKKVMTRPVTARAIQFRYYNDGDATLRLATMIQAKLGVTITSSYDPQSGVGYFLRCGEFGPKCLGSGDWILVDSFGRPDVVKEKDFNVYYEPALGPLEEPAHRLEHR